MPWARTFDIDVEACARCGGRLEVRAVVTNIDLARRRKRGALRDVAMQGILRILGVEARRP